MFYECQNIIHISEKCWDFVANNTDIKLEVELHNLTDIDFVYSSFGANLNFFSDSANAHLFIFSEAICMFMVTRSQIFLQYSTTTQ